MRLATGVNAVDDLGHLCVNDLPISVVDRDEGILPVRGDRQLVRSRANIHSPNNLVADGIEPNQLTGVCLDG